MIFRSYVDCVGANRTKNLATLNGVGGMVLRVRFIDSRVLFYFAYRKANVRHVTSDYR